MAINLTDKNKSLSQQINLNPQAILQIEGLDLVFGANPVVEFTRWDTGNWDEGFWDGVSQKANSRDLIDISKTTQSITQQILPDKGGSTSISSVNIQIVDKDSEVSQALSFDNISEILGRRADFYIGFTQGAFPQDAIPVFRGVVVDFYTEDGAVMVSVAHPEVLKKQAIYQQYQSELDGAIDASQTSITVLDTSDLLESSDTQTTTIKIDDEVMRVDSIDSITGLTVTRGFETTIAAAHGDESEVLSIYILEGDPIDLSLKLMLSETGNPFFLSDDKPASITGNTLVFDYYNIQDLTGLIEGDLVELTGANAGTYTITGFEITANDSRILLDTTLIDDTDFTDDFSFKSQYNVLSDGLGMFPFQVDVAGHQTIATNNPALFVDYKFYLKETIDEPQDFISQEIYFPQGLYSIPRSARASVKQVNPPLSVDIVPTINTNNITNITSIRQRRSLHKYLYNVYRFDYNEDIIEDKTLNKRIIVSQDSLNRIKGGRKQLLIPSKGLRNSPSTTIAIDNISQRLVDRYRFAPTYFQGIKVKYSDGFNLEVGDVLPFGGSDTQIVNLQTGARGQEEKLFEVVNKKLNIKTGEITLDLLETAFNINARSAVISLASLTGANSTATRLELKLSFSVGEFAKESDKWVEFAGQRIRVRNDDYTDDETVTLIGVDPQNDNFLLLDSALSFTPTEDYILEIPEYENTDENIDSVYKLQFAHFNAQVEITAVTDAQTFDVDLPANLFETSEIYVHSDDYVRDSFGESVLIDSILGSTITLNAPLSFTPTIGDKVEFSKFLDGQNPYQII